MTNQARTSDAIRVVYSIATKFAGGGLGETAYHGARGLYRNGMLHRLLCGAYRTTDIPATLIRAVGLPDRILRKLATYDRTGWLFHVQRVLFDRWAARRLGSADVLFAWSNHGLRSLRRAKAQGMLTVLEFGSPHPRETESFMADERARWGAAHRRPPWVLLRGLAEVELADLLLCQAEWTAETFRAAGVAASRIITVRSGVDVPRFQPGPMKPAHPFRALFLGQVGFRKGVPYLLEAWQRLGWHDAELWLAGNIDREIRPLLSRFRALPGVRFFGYRAEPLAFYQSADVFVFPSLIEGSAKVTFEAMACGLPLITTRQAGSVARDGEEAIFVPRCDADSVAAALERMRADERLRREFGSAARRRAECFPWEANEDAVAAALRSLWSQTRDTRALGAPPRLATTL